MAIPLLPLKYLSWYGAGNDTRKNALRKNHYHIIV